MVGDAFAADTFTAELFDGAVPASRGVYVATLDVPRTVAPLTAAARRVARDVDADQPGVLEAAQATELVLRRSRAPTGPAPRCSRGFRPREAWTASSAPSGSTRTAT